MDLSEAPAVLIRRHPWEAARLDFFRRLLRAMRLDARPIDVLDVGSGDAWLATQLLPSLHAGSRLTCWDAAYTTDQIDALSRASRASVRLVADQPSERFDLALLLDVLEHVEQDEDFLERVVAQNLKGDAHLVMSVPAWPFLFGDHDVQLRHFRRYAPGAAAALLERAGLTIVARGGLFHSLILPRVAERLAARVGLLRTPPPNAGEWRAGPVVTAMTGNLLKLDALSSMGLARMNLQLPGLSWWAICRKRSS